MMDEAGAAWANGDLDVLRARLHPEGTWAFVDDRPRVINDPDRLIDAIREIQQDGLYQLSSIRHTPLSDRVVLGTCQVRTSIRGRGGHNVRHYYLLLEVRDGLFYRSESFPSENGARAAFERGWGSSLEPSAP